MKTKKIYKYWLMIFSNHLNKLFLEQIVQISLIKQIFNIYTDLLIKNKLKYMLKHKQCTVSGASDKYQPILFMSRIITTHFIHSQDNQ